MPQVFGPHRLLQHKTLAFSTLSCIRQSAPASSSVRYHPFRLQKSKSRFSRGSMGLRGTLRTEKGELVMFKRARHEFSWLERKKSMCAKFYPFSPVSQESFSLQVEWNSDCFLFIAQDKRWRSGPPPASRSMAALTRHLIAAYARSRAKQRYQP
jgi:hypothetical protein